MLMVLTKEFVNSCRKVGVLRDFLLQAMDQVDNLEKENKELKADKTFVFGEECEAYKKSEADKVISDLEIKLATAQQVLRLNKPEALYSNLETMGRLKHETDVVARRECHQKHKRCLAMAKWCFTKSNYHFVLARHGEDAKENNRRSILYSKWRKRWLKIAKKFKMAIVNLC